MKTAANDPTLLAFLTDPNVATRTGVHALYTEGQTTFACSLDHAMVKGNELYFFLTYRAKRSAFTTAGEWEDQTQGRNIMMSLDHLKVTENDGRYTFKGFLGTLTAGLGADQLFMFNPHTSAVVDTNHPSLEGVLKHDGTPARHTGASPAP